MRILKDNEKKVASKYFEEAVKASKNSICLKRPRGVVIVKNNKIVGKGWNAPAGKHICSECLRSKMKPKVFAIFNTEPCYAIHAEQRAIVNAFKSGCSDLTSAKMYFIRTDDEGKYIPCDDGPSCTICSKLILESGIESFIYEALNEGIVELSAKEFNDISMQYVENLG